MIAKVKRESYMALMAHSHVRRQTWIPVQGPGPVSKMASVTIQEWGSVPFCVPCS